MPRYVAAACQMFFILNVFASYRWMICQWCHVVENKSTAIKLKKNKIAVCSHRSSSSIRLRWRQWKEKFVGKWFVIWAHQWWWWWGKKIYSRWRWLSVPPPLPVTICHTRIRDFTLEDNQQQPEKKKRKERMHTHIQRSNSEKEREGKRKKKNINESFLTE